jgi:hypothetical protein
VVLQNSLSINATKSGAIVVNPKLLQLDDSCQISLDGKTKDFHYLESKKIGVDIE